MKSDRFRILKNREVAYNKYKIQFASLNYQSADFPSNPSELVLKANSLKDFLIHRSKDQFNNEALLNHIHNFIKNESLYAKDEYLELLMIIGMMFDLSPAAKKDFSKAFDEVRKLNKNIQIDFFSIIE